MTSDLRVALGSHTFGDDDQRTFAAASGDHNPMHMDPVAARRLISGRAVVHGVHTLLHALEAARPAFVPRQASCSFSSPVSVGDTVAFAQRSEPGRCTVAASVDGLVCTEVVLDAASPPAAPPLPERPLRVVGPLARPLDEAPGSQAAVTFELPLQRSELDVRFPRAAALVGPGGLAALAACSTFVGMVCPGQHSVFSSLRFALPATAGDAQRFGVSKYDPRFRLFVTGLHGVLAGELRAFLRPPPQPQPSMAEVAARVDAAEFRGTRSLVVGGSRGLGETTAKIIAAGGGDVWISYAAGRADAEAVAAEINAAGPGRCEVLPLDLGSPLTAASLAIDPATVDAVYYFATPRIYTRRSTVFDRRAFDAFAGFYLERFHELCLWLEGAGRARPSQVYLPSTVFIDERPKGMTEYTMAKAAAEVLADDIGRSFANVRVQRTRLPRLATDQTSSILGLAVGSNLDALLPVVRQMSSAISSL